MKKNRGLLTATLLSLALASCVGGCDFNEDEPTCTACHRGLEKASRSHSSCTPCHGGDDRARDKELAHAFMFGPHNPASPLHWERTCGSCHRYQLARVQSSIMYTAAGMIRNIQLTWEGGDPRVFSVRGGTAFDSGGNHMKFQEVAGLGGLSGELFRKFCSTCHVGIEKVGVPGSSHASGCACCHFPHNDSSTYEGQDAMVRGRGPHSASHALCPLPPTSLCARCHNRSGRIALSYVGLAERNNSLVPTRQGRPGPLMISGGRNVTHISPDVHFARGMDCIDCHTSREIMGDGYAYLNMYHQTEIGCEDCHGSGKEPPRWEEITRENSDPLRESRNYSVPMRPGMKMVLTAKGRPYSNVFYQDGTVFVLGKRTGRLFQPQQITGTPEHLIAGHERLECYACHSKSVVQCFGCHIRYDRTRKAPDYIEGLDSPGDFSETEDYRMLYPFPLALNQRGKISPVTPGCQTFVTVIEMDGTVTKDEYVPRFRGKSQVKFAPFFSHNIGERAVGCTECHSNPAFLGFGQGVMRSGEIEPAFLCEHQSKMPLDGFLTLKAGHVRAHAAITRPGSQPLEGKDVRKVWAVNLCLVCHDEAKDPIYRAELDYSALDDPLHRRLLGPQW